MTTITFTQFLRPHGERKEVTIDRPEEIGALAQRLLDAGCRFEAEVLTTDEVSLTVERGEDETLAIDVVANGLGIPHAVDVLIRAAVEEL